MDTPIQSDPKSLLGEAIRAAQGGNFDGARAIAEDAIANHPDEAAPFHAFLGMVEARRGDLAAAAGQLRQAHEARPGDVTIACNLITVLMDLGEDSEGLAVASEELMRDDASLRVARLRAFLAQKLEAFPEAVEAYEYILASEPNDFECLNNLGNALAGCDQHERALEVLRRAIALEPAAAPTRMNLIAALIALGREEEAERELTAASDEFPADSRAPYQLYVLYKSQQKQDEAVAAIEEAAARNPDAADIQLKLGIEYGVLRRTEDSERAYRRSIALNPLELDAYLGLAVQYEHTNREEMFAPLIEEARANGIAQDALAFIEALEFRRLKQFEEALSKVEDVDPEVEPIRTAHIRATLLDRLGRTDEAFAAYLHANRLMEESPSEPLERAAELRQKLEDDLALLTPEWRESWQPVSIEDARPDPVFLMGFPRSGTTLLDTIVMGHRDTVVMEEQPPLNIVEGLIGGSAALGQMGDREIEQARNRYYEEVGKVAEFAPGKMLVDKSPLFLYRLPLIRRLFPNSKIILALRHPCDVVLSCFMSNFRLNPAMSNFLRLEDAARFYDLCFTHWKTSRALFGAEVHSICYERLVDDVEREVRPLIDWLGLEWDDSLLDHTATARSRGLITTASYSQVTEPIYKRASGRWLRYREHLDPILDQLAPWCEEFGYEDPRQSGRASSGD
ncbi:sulfotransferase [Altererythrobacter arenosus]|uniref:Sulfotransferase n=1 Tax=Altererythrobacter arenosus TaxID=3032592 RepID=A0ABY8FTB0_9SPHN|nr:sulfotransferase [Altererythrobacter sp. CAU 1644]WFL78062.1 sulfotransferase [Altererythrobacter sp. CAU 1644]